MNVAHRARMVVILAGVALAIAGCQAASPPPAADGGTTVEVTLQEWAVVTGSASAPAGEVTFVVTNEGPDDVHEFVVVSTDLEPDALPTDENGMVDEAAGDMEVIGEIEDIPVGETQNLTVTLEAGNYVLLCNIYTAEENEAHYAIGMRTAFTVE